MHRRAPLPLILALLTAPALAQEPRDLPCETQDGRSFRIALWTPSEFGQPLHCVEAPEVSDVVAACAPDGGWGLSRADELLSVATEAKGIEHEGGWFFARLGPSEFVASASVGTRIPYALEIGGETFWRMRLELATGRGKLFTRDGATDFSCAPA